MSNGVRKPIWENGEKFQRFDESWVKDASDDELRLVQTLRYVEHAKKQVGVASSSDLYEIGLLISEEREGIISDRCTLRNVIEKIASYPNIGVITAICMIARILMPHIPPIDRKVICGFLNRSGSLREEYGCRLLKVDESNSTSQLKSSVADADILDFYFNELVDEWDRRLELGDSVYSIDASWLTESG